MERKEAIRELKFIIQGYNILLDHEVEKNITRSEKNHYEKAVEALNIAIASLETDEAYQLDYENTTEN